MGLSFRLIALVLIAAGPTIAFQFYNYTREFERRQSTLDRQAAQLTKLAATQLDNFLEGIRKTLSVVVQLPEVRSLDPDQCSTRLAEVRRSLPGVAGLGAVRRNGIAYCGSNRPVQPIDLGDRVYFREAVRTKEFVASGLIVGRRLGTENIVFAQPVLDDAENVTAVVVLVYKLADLSERLKQIDLPENSVIALVDEEGRLLARAPAVPDAVGKARWEGRVFAGPGTGDNLVVEPDGARRLYNMTSLASAPNLFVSLGVPVEEALTDLREEFWLGILALSIVFVLAGVAAFFAGRIWISRPLQRVQQRVHRLAEGDLKSRVGNEIRGPREIVALGRSFDSLAEAIASLVSEIDHRANNQLSVVQSLVQTASKKGKSADEFSDSLAGRLDALGRIQNLVSHNRWQGVSLQTLVEAVLQPIRKTVDRITVAGGIGIVIPPNVVFALGLAIHELGNNAIQYGALSVPSGRVEVSWQVNGTVRPSHLILRWIERNGPSVGKPDRTGIGWTVIKRRLEYELDAKVDHEFKGDGLRLAIEIPLRRPDFSVAV